MASQKRIVSEEIAGPAGDNSATSYSPRSSVTSEDLLKKIDRNQALERARKDIPRFLEKGKGTLTIFDWLRKFEKVCQRDCLLYTSPSPRDA